MPTLPAGIFVPDFPPSADADQTDDLNRWLSTIPVTGVAKLEPGGEYLVDGTVKIPPGITVDGTSATFFTDSIGPLDAQGQPTKAARTRSHVQLQPGDSTALHGLSIVGPNPSPTYVIALEAQHGIDVEGTTNATIDSVTIEQVYGDFVYWGPDSNGTKSGGELRLSTMSISGRQGVSFSHCDHVVCSDNVVEAPGRTHFDLEPNPGNHASYIDILRNRCIRGRLNFVSCGSGYGCTDHVNVGDNKLFYKPMTMLVDGKSITANRNTDWSVYRNVSDTPAGSNIALIVVRHSDRMTFAGNLQPFAAIRQTPFVQLGDGADQIVIWNDVPGAGMAAYLPPNAPRPRCIVAANRTVPGGAFDQPQPPINTSS